jgi:general secretion pathway protein M
VSVTLNETQGRRLLALLILLLMVGVVAAVTVLPLWSANQYYEEAIASMQDRLEKLQRASAMSANLQAQYDQLKRWQLGDAHYLTSGSSALAGAELQRIIKRIAASNNAELVSTQILPVRQAEAFTQVTLKARMRGTLTSMTQIFYAIETGEPFLFLDKVSLWQRGGQRRWRGAVAAGPQLLDVDIELTGYMRAGS